MLMPRAASRRAVSAAGSPATRKLTIPHRRAPRSCTLTPGTAASASRSRAASAVTRASIASSPIPRA